MKVFITGGTGTLGHEIVKQLYTQSSRITIFSRDELKQKKMKAMYPHLECKLGSVEDKEALFHAMRGAEIVFHLAALKHIDILEQEPVASMKVNVIGSKNVLECAQSLGVRRCALSSSDKAVDPINAYGASKLLAEKFWAQGGDLARIFRWGNVLGSRGSVLESFKYTILKEKSVSITDIDMTRFWIHIEDAARFMIERTLGESPLLNIPNMKAAPVWKVANLLGQLLLGTKRSDEIRVRKIGLRAGEKMHERLYSSEVDTRSSKDWEQYDDAELMDLLRRSI